MSMYDWLDCDDVIAPSPEEAARSEWNWAWWNSRNGGWDNPMNHRTRFCNKADELLSQRGEVRNDGTPDGDEYDQARRIADHLVSVTNVHPGVWRVKLETMARAIHLRSGVTLDDAYHALTWAMRSQGVA